MSEQMKLSEAIRKGAKLRPQCTTGRFFGNIGTCALGAAVEAVTGHPHHTDGTALAVLHKEWKFLNPRKKGDGIALSSIGQKIVQMNDNEHMTREQIADWLAEQGL